MTPNLNTDGPPGRSVAEGGNADAARVVPTGPRSSSRPSLPAQGLAFRFFIIFSSWALSILGLFFFAAGWAPGELG